MMYLHKIDSIYMVTSGRSDSGDSSGGGNLYVAHEGDGDKHGEGNGDGTGEVEAHERKAMLVPMCVSQMYLIAQVLNINQGE